MSRKLLDDCFLHDRERMRHDEVLALLRERLAPVTSIETLPIFECATRFLAGTVSAPINVPQHFNAAVDGYAIKGTPDGGTFRVVSRIAAGDFTEHAVAAGEAARIFTGARMPDGADTVAMQEDCVAGDGTVTIPPGLKAGANSRKAGEDIAKGDIALQAGIALRPQDIARAASLGLDSLPVRSRLRIAVLSTGNELVEPGSVDPHDLPVGGVFNSNKALLKTLAETLPVDVTDYGTLPDDAARIESAVARAASECDLIMTTGGASRGEEDHVIATIDKLGRRHLWQIAVKPGRPMSFGQIGDCVFLGLPGNPVAAFVCFLLYARPAIIALSGGAWREPVRFPVPAGFSIPRKKADRREFWRGWLETGADGRVRAMKFPRDGSGLISGLVQATGLIEVPEEVVAVTEGDAVSFIPFTEFGITG